MKIIMTKHAKDRIKERVAITANHKFRKDLAYKAFTFGKTSAHYLLDGDIAMFKYLAKKQAKYLNKSLRVLNDMIYVFSLGLPTTLVTVFPLSDQDFAEFKKRKNF